MSTNINFQQGLKEYIINNDENKKIYINTNDFSILNRIDIATKHIDEISEKYENIKESDDAQSSLEQITQMLSECDKEVRKQIDFVFDSPVSDIVFGNTNCMSLVGGQPLYVGFLNALVPIIKKELEAEQKKSARKIEKYTKQVKK